MGEIHIGPRIIMGIGPHIIGNLDQSPYGVYGNLIMGLGFRAGYMGILFDCTQSHILST